jgi:hypothetical protein
MKCQTSEEKIALAAYGELPDDQLHELELHLAECAGCREYQEQGAALKKLMALNPIAEPSANQLASARIRLSDSLDNLQERNWLSRLILSARFARVAANPIAAAALLVATLGCGGAGGYYLAQRHFNAQIAAAHAAENALEPAQVVNVSSIATNPGSGLVQVHYNRVVPATLEGSVSDPAVQQMLMMASENSPNAGIRNDSVGLLAAECRTGHACNLNQVRNALMMSLRYDRNPAVRMKALDGLEPYIAEDLHVRDVVLESLMNDSDPRVRSQSIQLLMPVQADSSVRQVLTRVSTMDDSAAIRSESRQALNQIGEIQ